MSTGVDTQGEPQERTPPSTSTRAERALGWALIVAWGVLLSLAFWTAPRQAIRADLAADSLGDVRVWQVQDKPPAGLAERLSGGFASPAVHSSSGRSPRSIIVWQTHERSTYWADVSSIQPDATGPAAKDPGAEAVVKQLSVRAPQGDPEDPLHARRLFSLLTILTIGAVIFGPHPVRGTRWFWFWVVPATLGVGIAWYAWAEIIRQRPRAPRRTGGEGFLLGLLFGVSAVLASWLGGAL